MNSIIEVICENSSRYFRLRECLTPSGANDALRDNIRNELDDVLGKLAFLRKPHHLRSREMPHLVV